MIQLRMSETLGAEFKKANFNKIIRAGSGLATNPSFGNRSASVGELLLANGGIVKRSSISFDLQPEAGRIVLGPDGIAESGYMTDQIRDAIILRLIVDTYRGEGSGVGMALAKLADVTVQNLARQYKNYPNVYGLVEDFATNRADGIERVGWSTSVFSALGYGADYEKMEEIGLNSRSRPMLIKKLG